MRTVRYRLCDPTGNMTILVTDPVPVSLQPETALRLMAVEKSAEQVGFLSPASDADIALRMAGGEFCGNASMSAAAVCALSGGLSRGGRRISVRVSGAAEPVSADITAIGDGLFSGKVEMPLPESIERISLAPEKVPVDAVLVRFSGISHIVLHGSLRRPAAEAAAKECCSLFGVDALGIMQLGGSGDMTPLVYVPGADTLFWESSCASGTAASGAAESFLKGESVSLRLRQPGGELTVSSEMSGGRLTRLCLGGSVRVGSEKSAVV